MEAMTQRGVLSDSDREDLLDALEKWAEAEQLRSEVREQCVEAVNRSSYREVASITGFSTNTLQRWKREAGK